MVQVFDKFSVCTLIGVIGAGIADALGGWDTPIQALLIFMLIDFVMGLIVAIIFKNSDKTETGGVSSKVCWKGIIKKVATLLIVVCSTYCDKLLETNYIRNMVVIAFCASELISIIELAALMKILPKTVQNALQKVIDVLNTKGGGSNDN